MKRKWERAREKEKEITTRSISGQFKVKCGGMKSQFCLCKMIIFDEAFEAAHEALKLTFYAYVTWTARHWHTQGERRTETLYQTVVCFSCCNHFISFFVWSFGPKCVRHEMQRRRIRTIKNKPHLLSLLKWVFVISKWMRCSMQNGVLIMTSKIPNVP